MRVTINQESVLNNSSEKIEFPMRLARFMSLAGVASRRESETLIAAGRVKINGETIIVNGCKVNAADQVEVDNKVISLGRRYYIMLNKPPGYTCTAADPYAEKIVFELIDLPDVRLFSAGRLDRDSEGLLILTNDGDYSAHLTHPRYNILKRYYVQTDRPIPEDALDQLRRGIVDEGERLVPESIVCERPCCYNFVLNEGKKREIRRMVNYAGAETLVLRRLSIGALELGELPSGKWRELSQDEIDASLSSPLRHAKRK
jgi:23S rRNA pseudouridine2605 synthase